VVKGEEFQELLSNRESYSFHKVDGVPALLRGSVVAKEEFAVGDKVALFYLPDGKYFISRADPGDAEAFTVGKVTPAHIYFDDEITLEER
jgi:hypothetical protein